MKKRTTLSSAAVAALALVAGVVAGVAAPSYAAGSTEVRPARLDRGPSGTVPHVVGSDLVVGDATYSFAGREVFYLGESGGDHVVGTYRQDGPSRQRVVRVTPDDQRTVVIEGISPVEMTLSADGEHLLRPRILGRKKSTLMKVWSAYDGTQVASRTFKGYVDVLDASEDRAVLSASTPERTFWWNHQSDATKRISARYGYFADIANDRLAVLTGDPYVNGCSVVSTLADASDRVWRSCDAAVLALSPDGTRMATVHIFADGLGPSRFEYRKANGKLLHTYETYYFGHILFEDEDTLLIQANGKEKSAWVRCTGGDCERTSRLWDSQV